MEPDNQRSVKESQVLRRWWWMCWLPYAGNCAKLLRPTRTASVRDSDFFSNRVINVWNSLPDTVVSSATVTGFKLKFNFLLNWCSHCNSVVQSVGGGIYQSRCPALVSRSTHFSSYCVCIHIAGCFSFIVCLCLLYLYCQINLIWFEYTNQCIAAFAPSGILKSLIL